MKKLANKWGCVVLMVVVLGPGILAALLLHSWRWIPIGASVVIGALFLLAAFGGKRKITPQEWAEELEKHLVGNEGPLDWDDTTSVTIADKRLERLRASLIPEFDLLDTPDKHEHFRKIIESLRRGEIPD